MYLELKDEKQVDQLIGAVNQSAFLQEWSKDKTLRPGKRLYMTQIEYILIMVQLSHYPEKKALWSYMNELAIRQNFEFENEYDAQKIRIEHYRLL